MPIWNKRGALQYTMLRLRQLGHDSVRLIDRNMFGHALIKTDTGKFYLLFKKDFLRSFNSLFRHYTESKGAITGLGESINNEYIEYAKNNDYELLFSYQTYPNIIYTPDKQQLATLISNRLRTFRFKDQSSAALLKLFCHINGLTRTQDKTNKFIANDYSANPIMINETTHSFPINLLKRL